MGNGTFRDVISYAKKNIGWLLTAAGIIGALIYESVVVHTMVQRHDDEIIELRTQVREFRRIQTIFADRLLIPPQPAPKANLPPQYRRPLPHSTNPPKFE